MVVAYSLIYISHGHTFSCHSLMELVKDSRKKLESWTERLRTSFTTRETSNYKDFRVKAKAVRQF